MDINPNQYMSFNYPNDQMWDQKRTQSCKCDRGYTGYDCNSRICPFGDDPTSDCGENSAGDVQLVVTKSPHDDVKKPRYFTLSFTDMFGGTFTTRPILDHAPSCAIPSGQKLQPCPEVQYALMDLPNFAIPEVEVDAIELTAAGSGAAKTATSLYTVQFTDPSNAGKQNTLTCELVADSSVDGAQPRYTSVTSCEVYNVGGPEWFDESGEKQTLNLKAKFTELANKQKADILGAANTANAGRKIEFTLPDAKTKRQIFKICTGKMTLAEDVNLEEFVMRKDDIAGADIKAICTEAGLLALRERRMKVTHEDFKTAFEGSCLCCSSEIHKQSSAFSAFL